MGRRLERRLEEDGEDGKQGEGRRAFGFRGVCLEVPSEVDLFAKGRVFSPSSKTIQSPSDN